ncbi:MAG TPA: AgmX/PglI C-terminal domain-containing protein [Polyangia bacterium]|nr:AgmX/PglI C-terminal domain-containing protein [Polyangia bacterium]
MDGGARVPLTFQIYKGDQLIRSETLSQDIIKIGKLASSHLRLDDESVSRMHAVIEVTGPDEIYIIDLGSNRGTVVNGQKVNKCKLQSGDEVQLGDMRILVAVGDAQVSDEAPTMVSTPPEPPSVRPAGPTAIGLGVPPPSSSPPPSPVFSSAPPPAPAPSSVPAPFMSARPAVPPPMAAAAPMPQPMAMMAAVSGEVEDIGTRSIEVTAMLGEQVVDVHHFSNPQSGQVTGKTYGLIGSAFVAILVALIAFFSTLASESVAKAAFEAHIKAGHEASKFMWPHVSAALDVLVVLAVIYAAIALVVGLTRYAEEKEPRDYTIGPGVNALYKVAPSVVPVPEFPLVHSNGADYDVLWTSAMTGEAQIDGRSVPLNQVPGARPSGEVGGAMSWSIPIGSRLVLDAGENRFIVSATSKPHKHPVPFMGNVKWNEQVYTGGSALAHALFLLLIFSIPPDAKSLSLDLFNSDNRFVKFLIKPPEEKDEQVPEWLKKKGPDEQGGKGKRHKGEEGKMGKKTSKNKTGLYGLKGPKDNPDPHLAKQLAEESAKQAGILGLLKREEGSHIASIFGRDSALGNDPENVLGGLIGNQIGEAYGLGGLGLTGTGRGGGGTGEGTIGLGNLGTIGKGGGGGSGSGYGRGAGGLGGRRAHAPDVIPGTAQVRGSLDKEIIRRIVHRHLNEVKFCYESEAIKRPELAGRVQIQWTISGTGQVIASAVASSTTGNATVDNCIAQAVRRWEFPKPQGGGIVIVNYPFVLQTAGAQ